MLRGENQSSAANAYEFRIAFVSSSGVLLLRPLKCHTPWTLLADFYGNQVQAFREYWQSHKL